MTNETDQAEVKEVAILIKSNKDGLFVGAANPEEEYSADVVAFYLNAALVGIALNAFQG